MVELCEDEVWRAEPNVRAGTDSRDVGGGVDYLRPRGMVGVRSSFRGRRTA